MKLSIKPENISPQELHKLLLNFIGPRPIALVSSINNKQEENLSPFSYFNIFSINPPILIFSPLKRLRNNSEKDTLRNVKEVKEVVINIVNYKIVEQTSFSSTEFDANINEFIKSGLTPIKSDIVKPSRVKESPVQIECLVNDIISLGDEGGAGNLVICKILKIHFDENLTINSDKKKINLSKIDLVGRMGGNWYSRNTRESLFEIQKPNKKIGIGFDNIPQRILMSYILSGNDLAKLANIEKLPHANSIEKFKTNSKIIDILNSSSNDEEIREKLHYYAKELLNENETFDAWCTLLIDKLNRI